MSHRTACLAILSIGIIAFGLAAYPALGQESTNSSTKPERRWVLTLSLGTTSSGPATDIESAMVASGFNKTSTVLGTTAHPFSRTGAGVTGEPWMISVQNKIKPPLLLGVIVSDAPIGETLGMHDPYLFLFIDYSVFTVSPTVSYQVADVLHLGIGPAIYTVKSHRNDAPGEADSQSATKFGVLLDVGLSIPAHSRFFAIASLQYRYVGNTTIGPYEVSGYQSSATMPATSVSYNHFFLSVGMGIRL